MLAPDISLLETNQLYLFRDWPNVDVPEVAAGVYTIWRGDECVYVGMAGRGLTVDDIHTHRIGAVRGKGLYSRLNSHASGRRSGDQFCLYICDRFVLPTLSYETIQHIAAGKILLDRLTRAYIHTHLAYRFIEVPDGRTALSIEQVVKAGALIAGRPTLNPSP